MTVLADLIILLDPIVGSRVYRDRAPEPQPTFPYITIRDDVSRAGLMLGDGRTMLWRHLAQVDLWQVLTDEDDGLVESVVAALDGVLLDGPRGRAYVDQIVRLVEPAEEPAIAHTAVTIRVAVRT